MLSKENNKKIFKKDKLLPLRYFVKQGLYNADYLYLLVNRKKLKAKRLGRNFYTTQKWFDSYIELHARDKKKNIVDLNDSLPLEIDKPEKITVTKQKFISSQGVAKNKSAKKLEAIKPEEKDLVKILEEKVTASPAQLVADLIEPEKKLSDEWADKIKLEEKDLKAVAKEAAKNFLLAGHVENAKAAVYETVKKDNQHFKNFTYFARIAISMAGIYLAILVLIHVAPFIASDLSLIAKQGWNNILSQFSQLAYKQIDLGKGQVAGVAEVSTGLPAQAGPSPMSRLLALANTTSRRSQEVINQAKYSAVEALENTAVRQKELSLNFGQKLASLTLASAKGVGLVSETGQKKLAQLENTISQTNQSIQQTGQKYLASEVGRSLWSLGDIYSRVMDFIIPDSLKNRYVIYYQTPTDETVYETPANEIVQVPAIVQPAASSQPAAPVTNNVTYVQAAPAMPENLSITGNADIGGYLNVSGPTTLKNKLTVLGQSEFLGDVVVNAALTTKTLLVTEVSQFNGTINAADIVANNLTSRGGLTVVGNSYIGGNELIQGNLAVSGTFSAGHTEFPSLGIHGPMGAQSVSAGSGGLMVSGSSYLSGEVYVNNILDIDINSGSALTVGDGSNDTFTVDTNGDVVTIAGALNLNGNMQLNGDHYQGGNATTTGNLYVGGDFSIGGTTYFASNFMPIADNAYDLGTSTARWRDLYLGPDSLHIYNNNSADYELADLKFSSNVLTLETSRGGSGTGRDIAFSASSSEAMRITTAGNIGIGTTTPKTIFHIAGTDGLVIPTGTTAERTASPITGIIRYNSTTSQFEGYGLASWGSLGGVIDVDQDTKITAEDSAGADNDQLKFFTSDSERMRLDANGNFMVGTTTSYAKLTVWGSGVGTGKAFEIVDNASTTRMVVLDGGNVGIGTSDPLSNLDVNGSLLLSGATRYINFSATAGTSGYGVRDNSGTIQYKNSGGGWTDLNAVSVWSTIGSDIYRSSGNVGMGTSTPNWNLQIASSTKTQLALSDMSAGTDAKHWLFSSMGGNLYIGTSTDALDATSTRLAITSSGNVGIGTANPIAKLQVAGDILPTANGLYNLGTTTMAFKELNIASSTINIWGRVGTNYEKAILGFQSDVRSDVFTIGTKKGEIGQVRDIQIKTGSNNGIYLNSSGNVGIGYTNPGATLAVNGMVGIGTTMPISHLDIYVNGRAAEDIKYGWRVVNTDSFNTQATRVAFIGTSTSRFIMGTDYNSNNTNDFFIATSTRTSGKPPFGLTSDGQVMMNNTVVPSDTANKLYAIAGDLYWNSVPLAGGLTGYWNRTGTNMHLFTTSDNVGMGTTTPVSKLQLDSAANTRLTITDTDATTDQKHWFMESDSGSFSIGTTSDALATNATYRAVSINSSGNFGIGTTTPAESLSTSGRLYVGGTGTSTIENNFHVLGTLQIGTGTIYLTGSSISSTDGSVSIGSGSATSTFANGLTVGTDKFIVQQGSGNVGIGTTNPNYNLEVYGTASTTNLYVSGNSYLSQMTSGSLLFAGINGLISQNNTNLNWDNTANLLSIIGNASTTQISSTGSAYFATSNGNVGIASTSPFTKLALVGDSYFTGNHYQQGNATTTGYQNIGQLLTVSGVGTSTIANNLNVQGTLQVGTGSSYLTSAGLNFSNAGSITSGTGALSITPISDQNLNLTVAGAGALTITNTATTTMSGPLAIMTNKFVVQQITGNVGIGTPAPLGVFHVSSETGSTMFFDRYGGAPPNIIFRRANGTLDAPTAVGLDNQLFAIGGRGYGATDFSSGGRVAVYGAGSETWTDSAQGAYLAFNTTQIGTASAAERLRITDYGNVGIGTTAPGYVLDVQHASSKINSKNGYLTNGADYAEYFYTQYTNLEPGETVCIDLDESNAVKRCYRGHDNNVMGIVSTNPSIIGNGNGKLRDNDANYVIIGMLGQVDAFVSAENGPINVGDSLTSASSTPGYAMRADGGDATVGVALEPLKTGTGKIKVLISRRNKSLAVEEIEALVMERVAGMKIEDEVQRLITSAVANLNLDPKIRAIAKEEIGKLNTALTVELNSTNGLISDLRTQTLASFTQLNGQLNTLTQNNVGLGAQIVQINNEILWLRSDMLQQNNLIASTSALSQNIKIDENGNIIISSSASAPNSGNVYTDGAITSSGTDYAEYFYSQYTNLQPGEIVCIDLDEPNAVKRCYRGHDNNVIGVVSTKPSFVGNNSSQVKQDPTHYAIIAMLGQVEVLASAENGAINVGEALTSASSTPGYAMRADGGDSTIGVALESLKDGLGKIKVLISRRNKSLAVEEVEALMVERIAAMKIEDEVQRLVSLNLDSTNELINNLAQNNIGLGAQIAEMNNEILSLRSDMFKHENLITNASSLSQNIKIDENGNIIIDSSEDSEQISAVAITTSGNVGIGTTTPYAKLSIVDDTTILRDVLAISSLTSDIIFKVDSSGTTYANGSYFTPGADYAEYFYSQYTNLQPGETVCIDLDESNAVKRCYRGHDNNVMGIVSTKPSIVGNNSSAVKKDPTHYAIVGMLGQVDAFVSAENGPINVGDSLTSASSTPGYAMKADDGDSTVGVALESFSQGLGKIKVLISRRNNSLAVKEVEALVVTRVAAMKIEDEVQTMVSSELDSTNGLISDLRMQTLVSFMELNSRVEESEQNNVGLGTQITEMNDVILSLRSLAFQNENLMASTTALSQNIRIGENGNIVVGSSLANATSTLEVQIINPTEITASSNQTVFVVNQVGIGEIADFQVQGVSVMSIAQSGEVKVVGSLLVDGRIMLCTGGQCSDTLDSAVDETMADLGVEGKVVAGAFEGYCDDGYVWVPGSAKYGTLPGFCAMNNLMEIAPNIARTDISQGEAIAACQNLGTGYHLLGENEWLTMAENILQVAANDIDKVASGMQLATSSVPFTLTNDNLIYNLAGSVAQWTDITVNQADTIEPLLNNWLEYYEIPSFKSLQYLKPAYYLTSSNGIGKIYTGAGDIPFRAFVRGKGGVYSLDLSHSPSERSAEIGFRCAK